MRFEEVSGRLGATVRHPGHADDGKRLDVAIPGIARMRSWQAVHGGYTWVICFEPGLSSWTDEERRDHAGYTASYRKIGETTSSHTIRIDGGPWDSYTRAEVECRAMWRQLKQKH